MHVSTELPLHTGKAPRWLFERMERLSKAICTVIIDEFGPDDLLAKLSDSNWFQALSCAVGYDWHSSGTTTVMTGALKSVMNSSGEIFFAGGKGKAGLRAPAEIEKGVDLLSAPGPVDLYKECSRLAAKIDSAMVYDEIGIYHHTFIFTKNGKWGVIQQAMSESTKMAIRFQWFSDYLNSKDFTEEPHASVSSKMRRRSLDLTNVENRWAREGSIDSLPEFERIVNGMSYPERHEIIPQIDIGKRGLDAIRKAGELDPKDYRDLLLVKGVGRSVLRSLAFVSSLIYDKELAYRDPVAYAYSLGGKDGIPFPVNRITYDKVIESMEALIDSARIDSGEKQRALKRLSFSLA